MIDEIEGIIVMVSDQQKALDFYTQKLGFIKKVDTTEAGFRWIIVGPNGSKPVISLVDPHSMKKWAEKIPENPEKKIGQPTGIWFFAKNIDQTYQELKSKGVEITEPKKQVWGGILSTVYDQDKNSFGLVGDSEEH
jgi:lactoylglutathione lyase